MVSKQRILCFIMLAGLLFIASAANAQEHQWKKFKNESGRMKKDIQKIYAKLDLTQEQEDQLKANKQKHRKQMAELFDNIRSLQKSLNQELLQTELDMTKIDAVRNQIKDLHARMVDERLNSMLEARKILSLEQFTKFVSLMDEHSLKSNSKKSRKKRNDSTPAK